MNVNAKQFGARVEFLKRLNRPYHRTTASLMRACITYHRLCEYECNGCTRDKLSGESWSDYDHARENQMQWIEKRTQQVESLLKKRAKELDLTVGFEGDPRGCTVFFSEHNGTEMIGADVWNW